MYREGETKVLKVTKKGTKINMQLKKKKKKEKPKIN